jgi:hypothetical protein
MSSSELPSPDSTDPEVVAPPDPLRLAGSDRTRLRQGGPLSAKRWSQRQIGLSNWPALFLLPVLIAIVQAASIVPWIHLIFGESFGLSGGRDAPWAGGLAIVGLAGFYSTLLLGRFVSRDWLAQMLAFIMWLAVSLTWLATVPDYDVQGLVADPWSLVSEHGYFVGVLFLAMGCWWQGIRYASDAALMIADEIRAMVQRCWGILLIGIFLAAIMSNESAAVGLRATRWAVPIAAVASMAVIAAAETESTRQVARSRGAKGPQWSRWFRIVLSVTGISAVLSLFMIVVLGPGALAATIDVMAAILRVVGLGLGYIAFAIFYLLYQVIRAVYYLITLIFGDLEMKPPEMPQQPAGQSDPTPMQEPTASEPWEQAELLRWIALGIAVILVAIVIFRIRRRATNLANTGPVDESRDSVFSAGLLRNQLKDLFRRSPRAEKPTVLDLNAEPASIRESFMFLHVLANRQNEARHEAETPEDFARRLRAHWPGTADPLHDLTRGYERVRYGDMEDTPQNPDFPRATRAWSTIWERRKDWEPPEPDDSG